MPTLAQTIEFAERAHRDQRDAGGKPYVEHLKRVLARVRERLEALPSGMVSDQDRDDILAAAILHDILEDHEYTGDAGTVEHLIQMGYPDGVIRRVQRLSGRPDGVTYIDNIRAMVAEGDLGVMLIKLSDNEDNSLPERIAQLPPERQSIARRYERSMAVLRPAVEHDHVTDRPSKLGRR